MSAYGETPMRAGEILPAHVQVIDTVTVIPGGTKSVPAVQILVYGSDRPSQRVAAQPCRLAENLDRKGNRWHAPAE